MLCVESGDLLFVIHGIAFLRVLASDKSVFQFLQRLVLWLGVHDQGTRQMQMKRKTTIIFMMVEMTIILFIIIILIINFSSSCGS